ncbi:MULTISPECIES: DUF2087 domain-containing protein [unclassified Streptomyces]|uniref:DUF2087 domain-containing protein n=1 Tax=unclassified Streptomyces TaxID=2593676 RepID=UPI0022B6D443|nr:MULTISPECIES: DUF2087 domain-containing protein [unclassified Streptomyces]MCZ7417380.1 DUF2087 domain-containing protein [Streptomyces sp. WMMC897]MCZ7432793.1 DUF2087 domain-containing protein [Streptomyces sp. WMMC1477]
MTVTATPDPAPPAALVGLLAEPVRLRVFSAVVLGADSVPEAARAADVTPQAASAALQRLNRGGLVEATGGRLRATADPFKAAARRAAPPGPAQDHGTGDTELDTLLRTFTRGERLLKLPAQFSRRATLLRHLAARTFEPGERYAEREVNARLRAWCEGSTTDHVTVRRHLVDHCVLTRAEGHYWLTGS